MVNNMLDGRHALVDEGGIICMADSRHVVFWTFKDWYEQKLVCN